MDERIVNTIYQDLVDDSDKVEWKEIEEFLNQYPRINTAYIYTNEEQTDHKPTNNHIFVGQFNFITDDRNILGAFKRAFEMTLNKSREIYVRVSPEISEGYDDAGNKLKRFYARILTVGDNQ
ncbi:hypothetical protein PN4B1_16930 [Paenibacillus naphthalenovorans]|uniref:hypothetical protein n=1 Tax=Paenibacillus naphthalenovorans TaxID=162209 RepID=UPI0010B7EE02|nr:hypothetical protein [Paenibacillus naphthalenovorans]GCL71788.1 hypothetical protein PN4B1_16930 [Paenibacillus naphthalenovorans]